MWNRATEAWNPETWEGLQDGDRALAALLLVHGLVQNGGVLHAVEALKPVEIRRGSEGYRYFGLDGVADLMDGAFAQMSRLEVSSLSVQEELEHVWDRAYQEILPTDQALADAFEAVYAHASADFAPPRQPLQRGDA